MQEQKIKWKALEISLFGRTATNNVNLNQFCKKLNENCWWGLQVPNLHHIAGSPAIQVNYSTLFFPFCYVYLTSFCLWFCLVGFILLKPCTERKNLFI